MLFSSETYKNLRLYSSLIYHNYVELCNPLHVNYIEIKYEIISMGYICFFWLPPINLYNPLGISNLFVYGTYDIKKKT